MKTGLKIGNKMTKKAAGSMKKNIISLYKSAAKYRISDAVLTHSISSLVSVAEVKNISVSDCVFNNAGVSAKTE